MVRLSTRRLQVGLKRIFNKPEQCAESSQTPVRKCTNISSLFICAGFVVLLFFLVIYCAVFANLDRLTKGYDDCGYICGKLNERNHFRWCESNDKREFPKLLVESVGSHGHTIARYKCVERCPSGHHEVLNRCFVSVSSQEAEDESQEVAEDLLANTPYIAAICVVAFFFSYIVLILFRYVIKYIIWIIYSSFVVLLIVLAILMLVAGDWVSFGILLVVALVVVGLLYWFRRKIALVAKLFKEASKSLIDVPGIMFEPILTFVALAVAFVLFIFFAVLIQTAGRLEESKQFEHKATYAQDPGMVAAAIVNFVAFIWFTQFIFGCQHFVIAGTICKWYFARDKSKLDAPIRTTFSHLVHFHLGSVCLGSMAITVVKIVRLLVAMAKSYARERQNYVAAAFASCLQWVIEMFERLLQYLVRNAYILIAKDGKPLIESGKQAYGLLSRHLVDVVALNYVGDMVLVIARLFIVGIAGLVGFGLMESANVNDVSVPLVIGMLFALLIGHCFVTVFEMTVDTIFLCFCIDCEENDGVTRPYFMSDSLRKIMSEIAGENPNYGPEGGHIMNPPPQITGEKFRIVDEHQPTSYGAIYPSMNYNQPPPPHYSNEPAFNAPYPPIEGQYNAPYPAGAPGFQPPYPTAQYPAPNPSNYSYPTTSGAQ